MRFRTFLFLAICWIVTCTASAGAEVLSFKEWKTEKTMDVRQQYSTLEDQYMAKKTANPKDKSLGTLYRELKSSKLHLDELQDLSVTDYFISYLSQYKDKKTIFQSALTKLEPQEISELMGAYANSLLKTSGEGLSTAAENEKLDASK